MPASSFRRAFCRCGSSMEFHLVRVFAFILLSLVLSEAVLPPEDYWGSVLPRTAIPKAVRDLLPEEKSNPADVQKGNAKVDIENKKPSNQSFGDQAVSVDVGGGGVSVDTRGIPHTRVQPPYTVVVRPKIPFFYKYAASEDQLHDDPNVALFFLEKDLHPSTKMNLLFTKTTTRAKFLPRPIAEAIPFSLNKFSEILNRYSVKPESVEANIMKKTIDECEEPAMEGEDKYCATSLEAMVDYSTSRLGKNVQAMSTEVSTEENHQQEFLISAGVKNIAVDKTVVCHGQNYVYPVFYCHATNTTRAYLVPLIGADGAKAKAIAVCHTDTSKWNPKHLAFQVLKVKPGTVPICHFLPEDHILWASK